jgi:hypothetical protein
MTTRTAIENAVYTWVATATGATTIFQHQAWPRPDPPYLTIRLGVITHLGHDEERSFVDPGAPDYATVTYRGDREIAVSVQALGAGALELARAAARALVTETTRSQLGAASLFVRGGIPPINDLTALIETDWEERAQFDVTLGFSEEHTDTVPLIETVETHGIYLHSDTATVHYPEATLAGVGGLTAAMQYLLERTATLAGVGALTASHTRIHANAAATLAGAGGAVTAEGELVRIRMVSATLAGAGAASAGSYTRTRGGAAATLAGVGGLTGETGVYRRATATLAGAGAVTATSHRQDALFVALTGGALTIPPDRYAEAELAGAGAVTATAGRRRPAAATLAGAGAVTADGQPRVRQRTAALAGAGAASAGTYQRTRMRTATIAGAGAVTATAHKQDCLLATL